MKRILSLLAVTMMVMAIASCGSSSKTTTGGGANGAYDGIKKVTGNANQ